MDHFGLKTRSQGQMLEKPCVPSRGHIFSPIILKLGQNVGLDEKTCVCFQGHIFLLDTHETWSECLPQ